jgi:hypothetical protein
VALVAGVDLDADAEAGAERQSGRYLVDRDLDGQALHDLDPIAGGILRRQDGEAGCPTRM